MTPYYDQDGITIYHGDCRAFSTLSGDVVITDPPYDERTHAGARTLDKETRIRQSTGKRAIVAAGQIDIAFDPADVAFTGQLWQLAKRWALAFCAMEMLGAYAAVSGDAWIRAGFWRRPDGAPQITGDRPGQPGEGIAIMHRPGKKRWNGGGHHAYWEVPVVKRGRVHPTQKPDELMVQLVTLFSDPDEVVFDPFMGSGTTLVAAKRIGRKAIGVELEEQYCEAAAKRLEQGALNLWETAI